MSLQLRRAAGFRRPFRRFRRRRKLRWQAASVGTGILGPSSSERLVMISAPTMATFQMAQPVITRIRGEIVVDADATPLVELSFAVMYLGIRLSDTGEGVAGSTYDNPFDQSYTDDWMWWQAFYLESRDLTDTRAGTLSSHRFALDVRSKRRVDPNDELVAIAVNVPPVAPAVGIECGMVVNVRILVTES